jgi:hypothetical protein
MSEHGWVTVENETDIARLPEDMFDCLTDITNEVALNDEARREAHPGPDRPPHAIRRGVDQGQIRRSSNTSGSSVGRRGPPSLVREALGARGEGRISPTVRASRLVIRTAPPQGHARAPVAVDASDDAKREERNLEAVRHLGAQQIMTGMRARALAPFVGADPRFAV